MMVLYMGGRSSTLPPRPPPRLDVPRLDVTTWIPPINDFPAVSVSQQKDQLSVSISHQAPLESSKFGWLIRSSVEVVLPMATVLNAQFGSSVFKLNRFACEMEPSKLLPQCLYIAAWNIH
jgi:hypothetical protein